MEQFEEIKRYPFPEILDQISEILDSNGIEYVIEDTKPSFDITFSNSAIVEYILKVKNSQKEKALELLENSFDNDTVNAEHYMDSYTDEELIEVISMPNDWDKFDLEYAKKLIKKRGVVVDEEILEKAKLRQGNEFLEPIKAKAAIVLVGYLFSLFGGWIGLVIALHLKYKKKEIEGSENIFYYDEKSRSHGDSMLIIGIIWVLIWVVYLNT